MRLEYLVPTRSSRNELFDQCSNRVAACTYQEFRSTLVDWIIDDIEGLQIIKRRMCDPGRY